MLKNRKIVLLFVTLIALTITLSAISAADANDTADTQSLEKTVTQEAKTISSKTEKDIAKEDSKILKNNQTRNLKTEEQTVDFYVSDTSGSDDNDGSQSTPFKTIQTAIDKTKYGKTNNIYIKNGIYHGPGNTNLTIDGEKTINFIGENKEDTIFYGNASYDINETEFYWGSSSRWFYYENETGNWFMNITKGIGKITISNLTVSRMYAIGAGPGQYHRGDSISLYPIANVDNYGTLEVNNVLFNQNYGGVGSAIRNNEKATLTVTNSEFTKNQKSSSSGNMGILYNKGTATVLNSNFHDNYARWGTILNDNKLTVINTTLSNNIGYDGGSTQKYGAGIAFNSGGADFFNPYSVSELDTTIINSTFINCDQTSVWGREGNLLLTGNTFKDTTGILISSSPSQMNSNKTYIVENNIFDNIIGSTIKKDLSHNNPVYFVINMNMYCDNINIINNTISNSNETIITAYGGNIINNSIKITDENTTAIKLLYGANGANTITGNLLYTPITINTNNTLVTNNKIITTQEYAIISNHTNTGNNTITDNYLLSKYVGDNAVKTNNKNTVENNTPKEDDGNIYVSPDVTEAQTGTLENPTTIYDALTKIDNNKTIILLPGSTNTYNITKTIEISESTVKEGTTSITIESLTESEFITNTTMFNIAPEYNITLSNIVIPQQTITNNMFNNAGTLTFKEVTIKQVVININTGLITNTGTLNFINSTINNNRMNQQQRFITNTGTVNILENNLIKNNQVSEGAFIYNQNGELNIIGNNTFQGGTTNVGQLLAREGNVNIIGNNTFTQTLGSYTVGVQNMKIEGTNKITNIQTLNSPSLIGATSLTINGENIFENCYLRQGTLITTSNFIINGSNKFNNSDRFLDTSYASENGIINGSNIFNNVTEESLMNIGSAQQSNTLLINGSNKFTNNIDTRQSTFITIIGYLQIRGDNIFENNSMGTLIDHRNGAVDGTDNLRMNITGTQFINNNISSNGIFYLYGSTREGNSSISENYFINNTFTEDASLVKIYHRITGTGRLSPYNLTFENNLIDGISAENGGAISINEYEGVPSVLSITNNTFKNIKSNSETINLPNVQDKTIIDNTYENCTIGLADFTVSSELEGQNIPQNTPIPVTITAGLLHPEYYDANIMDKMTYYGYINDVNKNQSTSNVLTVEEAYTDENQGILNINAKIGENTQSNTITVYLLKPLNTTITATAPTENTVNKTTPITIILTDEEGNLVKDATITLTTTNGNETFDMANGVLVYQYTPTSVGNDTLTLTYNGNDTLNPTSTTTTLKVTVNKDEVIEELNNTVAEQNQTIATQEETIREQETSIETLNNTTQSQEDKIAEQEKETKDQQQTIKDQSKTIADLNKTAQSQQQTIKDQQNTINAQAEQIEQLQKENEALKKQNQTTPTTTKKATTIKYNTIKTANKGSTVKITGKLLSDNKAVANQKVTVTVNGKSYTATTTSTGAFTVNHKVADYNVQKVTYAYNGNGEYKASKNTTSFSVTQPTTLKVFKVKIPKKGSTIKISGKLLDANGKGVKGQTVKIVINGKTYTAKTYSSGYFTIQYKVDSYDKRTVTVTYAGSTLYKASKATTKFYVYRPTSITPYKLKTVKKGTTMKVSGKLVDITGKGVRARTVTVKINGKLYTAKTRNNGYFTVQYTPTSIGTNNVTFTFSGGAMYKASTNSTSFKVKA